MSKNFPYHPILFGVFPVLFLFSQNIREIRSLSRVGVLAAICLCFVLGVWGFLQIILRHRQRSAFLISMLCLGFFSYGYFLKLVWGIRINLFGAEIGRNLFLLPIWFAFLLVCIYWTWKKAGEIIDITRILNVLSLGLVVVPLANALLHGATNRGNGEVMAGLQELRAENPRDIYYIVLDRYADEATFQRVFGFDNSPFLDSLRARGFYVAAHSRANYPRTSLSLASSLNMEYLHKLARLEGEASSDYRPIMKMINNNRVLKALKKLGYVTINVGSWYQGTNMNPYADFNVKNNMISEFTIVFLRTTMAYPFLEKFGITSQRLSHYKSTLRQFEHLKAIPNIQDPTFAFAHTLITHAPFVFDRNGNLIPEGPVLTGPLKKGRYIEQLRYANKVLLATVDSILARSVPTPIIILQSDEGPFPDRAEDHYMTFDWQGATDQELAQKTGIFNAVLLPGGEEGLYPNITPVNTFRIVFDRFFGGQLETLPDRVFVNRFEKRPYQLIDVTDRVSAFASQQVDIPPVITPSK